MGKVNTRLVMHFHSKTELSCGNHPHYTESVKVWSLAMYCNTKYWPCQGLAASRDERICIYTSDVLYKIASQVIPDQGIKVPKAYSWTEER